MSSEERTVDVMGTRAHVIATEGPSGIPDLAVERLLALEARWSRFRSDSEISRLNQHSGVPVVISADTYALIDHARAGVLMTDGLFDPTLLPELRAAGYDRSFELLEAAADTPAAPPCESPTGRRSDDPAPRTTARIRLDPVARSALLGHGVEFDPGGIGKGLAADMVVDLLLSSGAAGALVSIGGDLYVDGDAPEHNGWIVAVIDPQQPDRVVATIALATGAVASTWRTKRTWTRAGNRYHHVIDPRSGAPAITDVTGVTVISGRAWQADVLAKAAFLAGPDHAEDILARNRAAGLLFLADGTQLEVGDFARYRT